MTDPTIDLDAYITKLVEAAPPLSGDQIMQLRRILQPQPEPGDPHEAYQRSFERPQR